MWDFEFTDTDPLDPVIEEEIKENTDVFKTVYMQVLPFSTDDDDDDDDDNTQVLHAIDCMISSCPYHTKCYFITQTRHNSVSYIS